MDFMPMTDIHHRKSILNAFNNYEIFRVFESSRWM
jgi:hypothetical protein